MKRLRKHRLTLAALGTAVGIVTGGLEIAREIRGDLREHREHVQIAAEERLEVLTRLCALEGGRFWRGDCVRARR